MSIEEDRFRLLPEDAEGVARDIDFCFECKDYDTARSQLHRLIALLSRTATVAALPTGEPMSRLVTGMNWYRAWIDRGDWRPAVAGLLLAELVMLSFVSAVYAVAFGWWMMLAAIVVAVPVEVYMGVAQMPQWRWDGPNG